VKRDFTATRPNQLWVVDFTYVATWSGVAITAFVTDVCSRRIVGWRTANRMPTALPLDALEMALWIRAGNNESVTGMVHHSDAGAQGGINWPSQHLDLEVADGQTTWMVSHADGEAVDAVTWSTADSSRCRACVLGQDCRGTDERGRCGGLRRLGASRQPLVPRGWRHADHRIEPTVGPLSVVH
jgi:hypothetical protein